MEYLHRIDPNITHEGALRILQEVESRMGSLRPKARRIAEEKADMIRRDIALLAAEPPDDPLDDFNYVGSRHHY